MTTTYGLLTAGHCQPTSGSFAYTEAVGSTTHTLTHVARKFDAASDIGWASISTSPSDVTNTFYGGSWRTVDTAIPKDDLIVNQQLCRYGMNGGAGCGTVQTTSYNPGSTCGPTAAIGTGTDTCSATYVELLTTSGLCVAGDSGGPVYLGDSAVGVNKGGSGTRCIFTSIDDIYDVSLDLELVL